MSNEEYVTTRRMTTILGFDGESLENLDQLWTEKFIGWDSFIKAGQIYGELALKPEDLWRYLMFLRGWHGYDDRHPEIIFLDEVIDTLEAVYGFKSTYLQVYIRIDDPDAEEDN